MLLADIPAKRAALAPGDPALEEITTGARWTFADLDRETGLAAALLAAHGVGAGTRVGVLCRNRMAFFALLFACARLGAILVPLNWRMPVAELVPLLADSSPLLLFTGAQDAEVARAAWAQHGGAQAGLIRFDAPGPWADRHALAPLAGRAFSPGPEPWYLLYTSGTTGVPKAVIQTYTMALANYVNISQAAGLRPGDRTLNFLPLFHTAGINLHTLPTLMLGGCARILPGFDVDLLVGLLAEGGLDTVFGVPAVYQALSLHPRLDQLDLTQVRHWGCGGAPLPDVLVRSFLARGIRVCNGMGMTETGPTVFLVDPDAAATRIGSVGKPQLLTQVRLVDGEGHVVPQGEVGELQFAGPNITPGYWNRPEATAAAFTADGWLRSGDIGRQDADGYFYIVGRSKEMFISGGENVYPAEVENVYATHPAVLEVAVVGRPDARWGEVGHAYLLARPGLPRPDDAALRAFGRAHLAAYKVPRMFHWCADLPRTAAGKVQKHLLPRDDA